MSTTLAAEAKRTTPRQGRSRQTVECILEAAAQLLEAEGERRFNTNAIAERAGVSIGALYRYFPDKRSILLALAQREVDAHRHLTRALLAESAEGLAQDRAVIRAFLQAFGGRTRARRVAMNAWLSEGSQVTASPDPPPIDAQGQPLSPIANFVLSRALLGAMRAAVLEPAEFLHSQEFEDELVRLSRGYLGYPTRATSSPVPSEGDERDGSSAG